MVEPKWTNVRAKIRVHPASEGGRRSPLKPPYRPHVRFVGNELRFGSQLDFLGVDEAPGGWEGDVTLSIGALDQVPSPQTTFELLEGPLVVATGQVLA